jgi:hypothetical protein
MDLAKAQGLGAAAQWALNEAMLANPLTAFLTLLGLVTGAILYMVYNWETVGPKIKGTWHEAIIATDDFFMFLFGMADNASTAVEGTFTAIANTITVVMNTIKRIIGTAISWIMRQFQKLGENNPMISIAKTLLGASDASAKKFAGMNEQEIMNRFGAPSDLTAGTVSLPEFGQRSIAQAYFDDSFESADAMLGGFTPGAMKFDPPNEAGVQAEKSEIDFKGVLEVVGLPEGSGAQLKKVSASGISAPQIDVKASGKN